MSSYPLTHQQILKLILSDYFLSLIILISSKHLTPNIERQYVWHFIPRKLINQSNDLM